MGFTTNPDQLPASHERGPLHNSPNGDNIRRCLPAAESNANLPKRLALFLAVAKDMWLVTKASSNFVFVFKLSLATSK
jgi:hypothetical protein